MDWCMIPGGNSDGNSSTNEQALKSRSIFMSGTAKLIVDLLGKRSAIELPSMTWPSDFPPDMNRMKPPWNSLYPTRQNNLVSSEYVIWLVVGRAYHFATSSSNMNAIFSKGNCPVAISLRRHMKSCSRFALPRCRTNPWTWSWNSWIILSLPLRGLKSIFLLITLLVFFLLVRCLSLMLVVETEPLFTISGVMSHFPFVGFIDDAGRQGVLSMTVHGVVCGAVCIAFVGGGEWYNSPEESRSGASAVVMEEHVGSWLVVPLDEVAGGDTTLSGTRDEQTDEYVLLFFLFNDRRYLGRDLFLKFNSSVCVIAVNTLYPKKYARGFCFAVLCCGYTLTDFPISIRLTSLALCQQSNPDEYVWILHVNSLWTIA